MEISDRGTLPRLKIHDCDLCIEEPKTHSLSEKGLRFIRGCQDSFGAPTPGLFVAKCSAEKTKYISERAKGVEKASCGETVVQKGVFGESVSSLPS